MARGGPRQARLASGFLSEGEGSKLGEGEASKLGEGERDSGLPEG